MCGIVGIASWNNKLEVVQRVERMAHKLRHRGPDDEGTWADPALRVALGHRRLSIIDLSSTGHQPMVSASGRYVIAYNGEIYNFEKLRQELQNAGVAPPWRGHSDTEVLLAAIDAWGTKAALAKAVGMFAIALWDRSTLTLTLARDRLGEKPLYYGVLDGELIFASELGALRAGIACGLSIDRSALSQFMRFSYVPSPQTIYRSIFKLEPGHMLAVDGSTASLSPVRYCSTDRASTADLRDRLNSCGQAELVDMTHDLLREAVGMQMVSDVSLGAFLSGGVDSSTIVALMQAQSSRPVRTFTIGFEEGGFDESPYARAVAKHLGTEHTELFVNSKTALDLISELPAIYDEPFADSSQIPTTLVSRLTRQHVAVSLSGDGGDELFAGYPRYQMTAALWRRISGIPPTVREIASKMCGSLSAKSWDSLLRFVPMASQHNINGRRIHRLARLLRSQSLCDMYVGLMSHWQPDQGIVRDAGQTPAPWWPEGGSDVDAMRRWDIHQYLPDDLLVKVDRGSMSAGLESRAPFLDHRVVELALALPEGVLIRGGVGKWIIRQVLDRYVPRQMIDRPKAGFEIPLGIWLRGGLREWAESLLDPGRLRAEGFLDATKVNHAWQEHLAGRFDRSVLIWNVLMFQAWLRMHHTPLH